MLTNKKPLKEIIEKTREDYINFLTTKNDGTPTIITKDQARTLYLCGFQTTRELCMHAPRLRDKMFTGGVVLPKNEVVLPHLSNSAADFFKTCQRNRIDSILIFHPASTYKTDVGYLPQEVLITLGYALGEESTHLISIIKKSSDVRIPRYFIKNNVGTRDMSKASGRAISNLKGIMVPGQIGPFPLGIRNPIFYFDEVQSKQYNGEPVNLATGHPNVSLTMRYDDIIKVLSEIYTANVKVIDILSK